MYGSRAVHFTVLAYYKFVKQNGKCTKSILKKFSMAINTTKSQNQYADNAHKYDCISQESLK